MERIYKRTETTRAKMSEAHFGKKSTEIARNKMSEAKRKILPFGESSFNQLFNQYRISAKRRGINFDLSKEYFHMLTLENCFYCGREPSMKTNYPQRHGNYIYNGIDRTDNSIGYQEDNVVACCKICNRIKGVMSMNELFTTVYKIYKKHRINLENMCSKKAYSFQDYEENNNG